MGRVLVASFVREEDVLTATQAARSHGFRIADVYTPYAVHGLDRAMGLRPSRLPWACLVCGLVGVASAFAFQFWTMARSWPVNVGGKPWNSLPAYVPVAFEMMVLCGGVGVALAFLLRSRLWPGKRAALAYPAVPPTDGSGLGGATEDRFILVLEDPGADTDATVARRLLHDCHAVAVEQAAPCAVGTSL
jgi:hypothetical protein